MAEGEELVMRNNWSVSLNHPCGRLLCVEDWCRPRSDSERLRDVELWFVWRGSGWMQTANRRFDLRPGFCAIMRPGGIYDAGHNPADPLGITFIHFSVFPQQDGPAVATIPHDWPEFFSLQDVDYFDAATRRIRDLHGPRPNVAAGLLQAVLLDLLDQPTRNNPLSSTQAAHQRQISQLVADIRTQPHRLPTVEQMAEQVGLSEAHFSRIFHQAMGQTARDFLVETRLHAARELLSTTDLSIGAIAERLGYADIYFFSRQFKRKTGITPTDYRRTR